ncbi:hypothetical protein GCM10025883_20680 [Mobilicoccus caccae]|uniref:DNA-directed DNA polymerase n=1 Tax=Mobilicoccus caccae TaxID=1859295 RepID=A0ABQ6ITK8_9MICO|nr:hypothetical protein GCM10025883_20680 [Mobilicoccus caccae]
MSENPASAPGNFVHLHCHTEYSMLDGAARIDDLFTEAARMGMPAIATTDHGSIFGAYEFWKKGRAHGVKPIIGIEGYVTPGTHRSDKTRVKYGDGGRDDVSGSGAYTHMTLLAENTAGMHNLFRLCSLASLEGYYFKPRMDRELLETYGKGIIATTGCPSGEVQTRLRLGQYDKAIQAASELRDIFGAENYYCELMDHGLDIERRVQKDLLRLARELNLPLVATNDLHYTKPEDAVAHAALLCVQSGSTLMDPGRFKFDADDFYLKSAQEMRHLWRELPEACDNTLLIAERCEVEFVEGEGRYMPRFPCPEGEDETSWFVKEVEKGLHERFPEGIPDYARKQAQFEIEVIVGKGYPGYFLVVADFIQWAKSQGIRVGPGRGSGAGSMCAYAMKITDLDPIPHGLIFERFLNPERKSMPDFDVDFDERRRGEVIRYVTEKYGSERVAQIVTYGTIKAKQALKDASRVMGFPFAMGEKLTKAMPPDVMGKGIPLSGVFDPEHKRYAEAGEFRAMHDEDPQAQEIVKTALGLEGLKRQWGVHAAGVIMSSEPLIDVIPIMRREQDGQIITQFDYPTCETLGLVKMDFLGLRNLTILDDALENVKMNRDVDLDLDALSKTLDDPATYDLLARGETLGVFQLDGGGMRTLLRLMRPDNFEDISAALALYRPGPMGVDAHTNFALRKNGRQETTPLDPRLKGQLEQKMIDALEPILGTTYGLVIYQEQVMEIAQKLAGYTLGNADLLRRAMGKKKREVLDAEFVNFEKGMLDSGFSAASVKALWDVLVPFSDYAFNKAHTAAYGLVSYWTGYLKANYPAEYMAALLTSVGDDKDKSALYLNECRHMRIKVLPPDVNTSIGNFAAVGEDIRFGMNAIRNVGQNVVDAIVAAREEKGSSPASPTSCPRCRPWCATSGPSSRSSRRARSTCSATPGPGWCACTRATSTRWSTSSARRRSGRTPCSARSGSTTTPTRGFRRWRARRAAPDPHPGVGQAHPAHLRARDARPLRQRPPAVRHRTHPVPAQRHLDRDGLDAGRRGRARRRRHGDDRRPHHRVAAQAHQEGRSLGHRHGRGPRGCRGVPVLPQHVHDRQHHVVDRRRVCRARPHQPARRPGVDLRAGTDAARHHRGSARPRGRVDARHASHQRARPQAQGRPARAPRRDRGPPAADPTGAHGADEARRQPARHGLTGVVRRPQGTARRLLPVLSLSLSRIRPRPRLRSGPRPRPRSLLRRCRRSASCVRGPRRGPASGRCRRRRPV